MKTLTRMATALIFASAMVTAGSASAWWNDGYNGYNNYNNDWVGDGDFDGSFGFSFGMSGHARGNGYGYNGYRYNGYNGYTPYGYYPYAYPYGYAPRLPAAETTTGDTNK